MLVKIFKRRANGSPKASIDYLLGKERNREQANLLRGNYELSLHLAESLQFKNKYTVGCLSFEEKDLADETKQILMDSFEDMIFAGLSCEQYNITWIEHKDKGRLELNFFIPNVELSTQKRYQPYYHKKDKILVDSWIRIQNDKYQLSDPHHPAKQQLNKILFSKDSKHTEIKRQIGDTIQKGIIEGLITHRQDVIELLQNIGFRIERITDKSISISHSKLNKNIRLTGVIYENREFDERLGATFKQETATYESYTRERIKFAQAKFDEALRRRAEFNERACNQIKQKSVQTNEIKWNSRSIDSDINNSFIINSLSRQSNSDVIFPISKLPRINRESTSEGIITNQTLRNRESDSVNNTGIRRETLQKSEWTTSFRNIKKIGDDYAKRIQFCVRHLLRTIKTGFTDLNSRKQRISSSEQRINESKRTVADTEQCLTDTNTAITKFNQLKQPVRNKSHQITM